ncbi:MAG: threonine--tRNA ligase, partial [Prevotella sp.]|nr:threonine--tRNA ligase [Prevotella sp.]
QRIMGEILDNLGVNYQIGIDEAAFYGPKLDIQYKNVFGKEDTMITVQWDALLAPRYDMFYIDQNGNKVRPNVIHRTSLGCYERTLAWMIEKYEGAFPTWLCPEQVRVLPISEKFMDYANAVNAELVKAGVRSSVDERAEKIGYKLRDLRLQRIPYALIVGQKEQDEQLVSVWNRKAGDKGAAKLADFIAEIREDIDTKALSPKE